MSFFPSLLLFWLAVAAAAILLAPYAGLHILTSPPSAEEQQDTLGYATDTPFVAYPEEPVLENTHGAVPTDTDSESLTDILKRDTF